MNINRHIKNKHKDIYLKENPIASTQELSAEDELRIKNLRENSAVGTLTGVSSVEIAFLRDGDTGKFKCSRCNAVIECTEEESDTALIEHVQKCQLVSEPMKIDSNPKIIKSLEESDN